MYLYVIASNPSGPSKIGFSIDPDKRVRQLQTGSSERLSVHYRTEVPAQHVKTIEKTIHQTLGYLRESGEWFRLSVEDAIWEVQYGSMLCDLREAFASEQQSDQ